MKIVIDCFKLVKGSGKSIGIYNLTLNLVRNLARYREKEDRIIVLGTEKNREDFDIKGVKFVSVRKYNPLNKLVCIFWELWLVTEVLKKLKADVVLFPRGFAPLRHVTKDYVIIHDMIPFYYHENYPSVLNRLENMYIMWRLKASARSVHGVLTDSEASKKDIIKYARVKADKVYAVYPGTNKVLAPVVEKTKNPYIAAITSGLPHKNAEKVIKTYAAYFEKSEKPMDLYIVGLAREDMLDKLDQYAPEKKDILKEHICCEKFFEKDEDMQRVIAESSVFLFMSRKEGFGFPPLEAMQMGVPVVCADSSSLPEVVGNAAILVNAEDVQAAAEALLQMEDTFTAETYVSMGRQNTKRFQWKVQAAEYRRVLEK